MALFSGTNMGYLSPGEVSLRQQVISNQATQFGQEMQLKMMQQKQDMPSDIGDDPSGEISDWEVYEPEKLKPKPEGKGLFGLNSPWDRLFPRK